MSKRTRLPEACLPLLGTVSDAELARKFGVSKAYVNSVRRSRNIPPFKPYSAPREWTDEMLLMLGTAPDMTIAKALGLSDSAVRIMRVRQGLPAFSAREFSRVEWTKPMLKLLGKAPDKEIAQRLGIGVLTVANKRISLEIPSKGGTRPPIKWTMEMMRDILAMRPADFGKKHGISPTTARNKQRTLGVKPFAPRPNPKKMTFSPQMLALLGTQSDSALARKFHCSKFRIRKERERLGIPSYAETHSVWDGPALQLLGKMPDAKLAARLRIGTQTVRMKRTELGIESFGRTPRRVNWTQEMLKLLGTMPDFRLANQLGVAAAVVSYMRRKMLIKPFSSQRTADAAPQGRFRPSQSVPKQLT